MEMKRLLLPTECYSQLKKLPFDESGG